MGLFLSVMIGVFGGYLLGVALSAIFTINYLPYYLMVLGAFFVPLISKLVKKK